MNILSLDPMYSPLHQNIMDLLPKGERYAILSSLGLSVYFNGVNLNFFNKLIGDYYPFIDESIIDAVSKNINHYAKKIEKLERRCLSKAELNYFSAFYLYFKKFIFEKKIDLVLMHNDLRWQHSIAIDICKAHNIRFIVTEQGLFRPYTSIMDNCGVNANSNVKYSFLNNEHYKLQANHTPVQVSSTHDSYRSYFNFFKYLLYSKIGLLIGTESKIVHNRHGILNYFLRFVKLKFKNTKTSNVEKFSKPAVFVPLQLENDTQLLVHSDFRCNQEVIDLVTNCFFQTEFSDDFDLVFKYHPNDVNKYNFDPRVKITSRYISEDLLDDVALLISVNSTSILYFLESDIPIVTLGRSIYDVEGVAIYANEGNLKNIIESSLKWGGNTCLRKKYLNYLRCVYSLHGAGYCYPEDELRRVLNNLL